MTLFNPNVEDFDFFQLIIYMFLKLFSLQQIVCAQVIVLNNFLKGEIGEVCKMDILIQ